MAGLKGGLYEMAVVEHCQCFDLSEFETTALASDEMVFAASPALGLERPAPRAGAAARADTVCSERGLLLEDPAREQPARPGSEVERFRRIVVFDDLHVIVNALLRGDGVAFISTDLIWPHVEAGRLREYRVPGFTHQRRRSLVSGVGPTDRGLSAEFMRLVIDDVGRAAPAAPASCG